MHKQAPIMWWFQWVPTSWKALQEAEAKVLTYLNTPYRGRYVDVGSAVGGQPNQVWTLSFNEPNPETTTEDTATQSTTNTATTATGATEDKLPLVLIHGFGAGVALWALNLDGLAGASRRPVYAMDVLGFGRSSRPAFDCDPQAAEAQLIDSLEAWRQAVGLNRFTLLGHSLGGFLAASYALRHPERVAHLVLADPWGFQDRHAEEETASNGENSQRRTIPLWARAVVSLLQLFNPLAALRVAGPWGPKLVDKLRPDLKKKFETIVDDTEVISNYIYHCNVQTPSGEMAFKSMTSGFGWAKNPMVSRIVELTTDIPITFIYGERSWIDKHPGTKVKNSRENVNVYVMPGAGHHVYADNVEMFNQLVSDAAASADRGRSSLRSADPNVAGGGAVNVDNVEYARRRLDGPAVLTTGSRQTKFEADIVEKPTVLVR